jgi:hypothetical protein
MANTGFNLPSPPSPYYGQGIDPSYSTGGYFNAAVKLDPQGAQAGEVLGGVAQGAQAGSAFGPIGAGVGAVFGGVATAIGGGARKRKQQREKRRALKRGRSLQQGFNEAQESFDQSQLTLQSYQDRTNIDDRIYNLYKV